MNGRKRQRRRTGSGDVVHVLIMYHVSQAMSFIVVGTRALGRSRHRLVLDTRRNEIHIGDDSDTVEGLVYTVFWDNNRPRVARLTDTSVIHGRMRGKARPWLF